MTFNESSARSPQPRPSSRVMPSHRSLRIGLLLSLAIVLILTGVISVTLIRLYTDERDAGMSMVQRATDADARLERQLLRDKIDALRALTTTDALRSGDAARIAALLGRTNLTEAGLTGGLAWVDANGTLRALSDDGTPEPVSFADRDWFVSAMRGVPFVGAAVHSRVRARAPAVTLAVPIGDAAAPSGVLAGGILLDRSGPALSALGDPGRDRIVVDRAGHVIIGARATVALRATAPGSWPSVPASGSSGVRAGVEDALGRTNRVVAWKAVPFAGWVTMRSVPEGALFGDARRNLVRGLVISGVISLAVLVLIWRGYRIIRRRSVNQELRARRQDDLTHAMSLVASAETRSRVAEAVVDAALPAIGARGGGISLRDADATHMAVLHRRGFDPPANPPWDRYPITEHTPAGAAVLYRNPIYLDDQDLDRRFPAAAAAMRSAGDSAWAIAPLMDGPWAFGLLTATFAHHAALDAETRLEFELLAERTAAALLRAHRHEQEHIAAVALQRSLLTADVDTIEGVTIDAVYYPGDPAFGVGGDWYDAVRVDDHRLLVMVGDVVGRGVQAAAAMGQLRAAARALSMKTPPGELLDALSSLAQSSPGTMATSMCVVLIDTAAFVIEYAHAGHPPVAAVHADGSVSLLEPTQRPLLGVPGPETPTLRMTMAGLSSLVLYTDGLVERRGESLDVCLERLTGVLAEGHLNAAAIAGRCGTNEAGRDDTVVVHVDVRDAVSRYSDLFDGLALATPDPSEVAAVHPGGKFGAGPARG